MTISFFGHSKFVPNSIIEDKLLSILNELIGNNKVEFYLGGYGDFDSFAYSCCKKHKAVNQNASLIFITPYITEEYQRNNLEPRKKLYDDIIYPNIEDKPLKFAISYRNKYMADAADIVIAYITHDHGGAYQAVKHAKRKGKVVINLAETI